MIMCSQFFNPTLYQRNDATPLYIKEMMLRHFISKKVRKVEQLCCERVIAHDVINIQDSIFWPRVESYNRSLDFCLVSTQGKIQSFVEL